MSVGADAAPVTGDAWVALQRLELELPPVGTGTGLQSASRLLFRGEGVAAASGGLRLAPGAVADLGTWLNAAPVGWWHALAGVDEVMLEVTGRGTVRAKSCQDGRVRTVGEAQVTGGWRCTFDVTGSEWMWVELTAGADGGELRSATWSVRGGGTGDDGDGRCSGSATVVVPTFCREDDALAQARRLLDWPDVVARVLVVDQGGTLRGDERITALLAAHPERLAVLEQDNLGGSGGYARGMLASLEAPQDAVLLSDDDAVITREGLRRLLVLQQRIPEPCVLGTALMEAGDPTVVAAVAEAVGRRRFFWGPADGLDRPCDVATTGPAQWSFLDVAVRCDYTGWWGTLLPAGAVARLGLPAPYFLKWDDAEYGLRARREGLAVATVPGIAVWHPTWAAKQTSLGWSSLPMHRNRLATAAAYRGGVGVLADSFVHQVKHVLSLQYTTAALWNRALEQLLEGPDWLGNDLRDVREQAQRIVDDHTDDVPSRLTTDVAAVRRGDPGPGDLLRGAAGLLRPVGRRPRVRRVAADELSWRDGLGADAVALTGPTGEAGRALLRRPRRARGLLWRAARLHLVALWRWRRLSRDYARALPERTTPRVWQEIIGAGRTGECR